MLLPDGSQIPPVPGARLPLPAEVQDRQALPPLALCPAAQQDPPPQSDAPACTPGGAGRRGWGAARPQSLHLISIHAHASLAARWALIFYF